MWKLIKDTQLKEQWKYYEFGCWHNQEKARVYKFVWMTLYDLWQRAVCHYKGHDWEDLSEATPDYGTMECQCNRCGYYSYSVLY
jgi:hypothetical protein